MKKLVLSLVVLSLVCSAGGGFASNTFEFDLAKDDHYHFDAYPGDSIAFTWSARDLAPDVVTIDVNDDPYPLFGGTGTYTVPGIYTIPPDVQTGVYLIKRCFTIRGLPVCTLRQTINVRRRSQ